MVHEEASPLLKRKKPAEPPNFSGIGNETRENALGVGGLVGHAVVSIGRGDPLQKPGPTPYDGGMDTLPIARGALQTLRAIKIVLDRGLLTRLSVQRWDALNQ